MVFQRRMANHLPDHIRQRYPLVSTFVQRPVTILMLVLATLLIGGIVVSRMDLAMMPPGIETRSLSVSMNVRDQSATWSPKELERRVTLPVEGELSTIPGIQELLIRTNTDDVDFELQFDGNTNLDDVYPQVRDRIERVKAQIGDLIGDVRYRREGMMGGDSIAWVSIGWDTDVKYPFDTLQNRIFPAIESTPGISSISAWGDVNLTYRVSLNRDKISGYQGVNVRDLLDKLQSDNASTPAGKVQVGDRESFVVVDSTFESLADLQNYPVGAGLRLKDVADIEEVASTGSSVYSCFWDEELGRYIGTRGVFAPVNKSSDSNEVRASMALKATFEELRKDPSLKGFYYNMRFNKGDMIIEQLQMLQQTLLWGGALAVLVLMIFLKRMRLALVIALSIPLSMMMALIVMYFAGEVLSMVALMGFTVAAGMLLDNAIVVSENIYRRAGIDGDSYVAATRGASEVGLAISLATLTTVVVFLAVIFDSSNAMLTFFLARLSYPIVGSLLFSILVALVAVPHVMGRVFGGISRKESRLRRWYYHTQERIAGLPLGIGRVLVFPFVLFWGRSPNLPAATTVGDWLSGNRWRLVAACLLALGTGAFVTGWLVNSGFEASTGKTLLDAVSALFSGDVKQPSSFSFGPTAAKNLTYDQVLPALTTVVLGAAVLPILLLVVPRREQANDQSPLVARAALLYGNVIDALLRRNLVIVVLVITGVVAMTMWAQPLVKFTESTGGGETNLRMSVSFPQNVHAEDSDPRNEMTRSTQQLPPHWDYFIQVRELLFGIPLNGAAFSEEQLREKSEKAREKFLLDGGSLIMRPGSMSMYLNLMPEHVSRASELNRTIERAMPDVAGFKAGSRFGGGGSGASSRVRILLRGKEYQKLEAIAEQLLPQLEQLPQLTSVSDGNEEDARPEALLYLDRARAQAYGVEAATMARMIGFQLNGTMLNDFTHEEVTRPIRVVFSAPRDAENRPRDPTLDDVKQIRIPAQNRQVPVDSVVHGEPTLVATGDSISRHNRQTTLQLQARAVGTTEEATKAIEAVLQRLDLPAGYFAEVTSGFSGFRGGRRGMQMQGGVDPLVFLWACSLVFIVMAFLFESLYRPLLVLIGCVPGALVGALVALILTGTQASWLSFIGILVLVGVSVNNGIVLVDLINRLRDEGMALNDAIRQACVQRLRPMLMTTATTVVGLIPMAIGSERVTEIDYAPLGRTILGGLVVSATLTLVLVPLLYSAVESLRGFMVGLFRAFIPIGRTGGQIDR